MITQEATVTIKADGEAAWELVKTKLPQVGLPAGTHVYYNELLKHVVLTIPATEVKL